MYAYYGLFSGHKGEIGLCRLITKYFSFIRPPLFAISPIYDEKQVEICILFIILSG
jgi:hypothetical protein